MLKNFISEYGLMIIYTILTAIAGFIGTQLKRVYDRYITDKTKKEVVETCVKAVEQLYHAYAGKEKFAIARDNIETMLSNKGISISAIEMDMLIEACVAEFNLSFYLKEKEGLTNG